MAEQASHKNIQVLPSCPRGCMNPRWKKAEVDRVPEYYCGAIQPWSNLIPVATAWTGCSKHTLSIPQAIPISDKSSVSPPHKRSKKRRPMAIYGKCLPSAQRSSVLEEGAQASHRTQLLGSSSEISTQETPGPASGSLSALMSSTIKSASKGSSKVAALRK